MADLSEIEALLDLDYDELLERLGASDDAAFATPENKRRRGLNYFRNMLERYRDAICANATVKNYMGKDDGTLKVQAAAAIADLMGGHGAATVAVLVVQSGVREICSDGWRNDI